MMRRNEPTGKTLHRKPRYWLGLGALLGVVVLGATTPVIPFLIERTAGAFGYGLHITGLSVRRDAISLSDLSLVNQGAFVHSGHMRLSFHPLLLELNQPRVEILHHAKTGWTLPVALKASPASSSPSSSRPTLLHLPLAIRILDGQVELDAPDATVAHARRVVFSGIDLAIDQTADGGSHLSGHAQYEQSTVHISGAIDPRLQIEHVDLATNQLALADLVDAAVDQPGFVIDAGTASDLHLGVSESVGAQQASTPIIYGRAQLHEGQIRVFGVALPLMNIAGPLDIGAGGITSSDLKGTLAGEPFEVAGGLTDLVRSRLDLRGTVSGDVDALRHTVTAIDRWPLSGQVTIGLRISGPTTNPLLLLRLDGDEVQWDAIGLLSPHVDLALHSGKLLFLDGRTRSGSTSGAVIGSMNVNSTLHAALIGAGENQEGRIAASVFLDGHGGSLSFAGQGQGVNFAGTGGLAPDRSTGWAEVVGDGLSGGRGIGAFALDHDLFVGGGRTMNLTLPALIEQLNGVVTVATLNGYSFDQADLQAQGISPFLLAELFPHLPSEALFDELQLQARGDQRALLLSQLHVQGANYALQASGIAGTDSSALTGTIEGQLAALSPQLHGEASGPFALITHAGKTDLATTGLAIKDGLIAGIPLSHVVARASLGTRTDFSLLATGAKGDFRVWGDPNARLSLAVHGFTLAQTSPVALSGQVDGVGWIEGEHGAAGLLLHEGDLAGLHFGGIGVVERTGMSAVLSQVALRLDTILAALTGHVAWSTAMNTPKYALVATIKDAEIASLLSHLIPHSGIYEPEASLDAHIEVAGNGANPHVSGLLDVPKGSLSGLDLNNGHAAFHYDGAGLSVSDGGIDAGSAHLRFAGDHSAQATSINVQATAIDIGELADAFAPTVSANGYGSFALTGRLNDGRLTSTGTVDFADLFFDHLSLGHALGHWDTAEGWIRGHIGVAGAHTRLAVDGAVAPEITSDFKLAPSTQLALSGSVTNLDLAPRLALIGIHAPVSGKIDAQALVGGTLGHPTGSLATRLHDAILLGMPITRATLDATLAAGKIRIRDAQLLASNLMASASGVIDGMNLQAPLTITAQATSRHLGELLSRLGEHQVAIDGVASTTLMIDGRLSEPRVSGAFALDQAHIAGVAINEAIARYVVQGSSLTLSDAELDLPHGTVTAAGNLPLTLAPFAIGPADAPLSLDLGVNAVDLAGLVSTLPANGTLLGQINGAVALEGTPASPKLFGVLHLDHGRLVLEHQTSIDDLLGTMHFSGTSATINAGATLGGGKLAFSGNVDLPDLTDIGSSDSSTAFAFHTDAHQAHLNFPGFGEGTVDGSLSLSRVAASAPQLSGSVSLSDAVVPASSLISQRAPALTTDEAGLVSQTQLQVRLNVRQDVRMRSGAIDLGAVGGVRLGGTVANPNIAGGFTATGGTVTYLNRSFRVQQGRVVFDQADGLEPLIDATATTVVTDPDPSSVRNTSGQATITLNLRGRPDHLVVTLSSDPAYTREQILGLLLDASLVRAVDFNGTSSDQNGGLTALNQGGQNGQVSLQNEALGLLDAQFTQSLISPLTTALGGAVGLSDLGVSVGTTGSVGLSARRRLNGNVSLFFAESIGYPTRQSIGIDLNPNEATALEFSVYQEDESASLGRTGPGTILYEPNHLGPVSAGVAATGVTDGVSISVKRRFP